MSNITLPGYDVPIDLGGSINPTWYEKLKGLADTTNALNGTNTSIIQQNKQSINYTCVLSDAGKFIYLTGSASRTFTIPANSSVAFDIGTPITFVNIVGGAALTIACGDTMILMNGGPLSGGNRTLANYGIATALKVDPVAWIISGVGLT